MRLNVFYEKENKKKLCFLKSASFKTEGNESMMSCFLENITLNKYSLHLIFTTNVFVLELSKCNKLSKWNPAKGINIT